ncbi:bifunctional protein FolD 2 [Tanacetum coccineum]
MKGLSDAVRTRKRTSSASTNSGLQAAIALNNKINRGDSAYQLGGQGVGAGPEETCGNCRTIQCHINSHRLLEGLRRKNDLTSNTSLVVDRPALSRDLGGSADTCNQGFDNMKSLRALSIVTLETNILAVKPDSRCEPYTIVCDYVGWCRCGDPGHGSETVLPDVSHRPSFVIMLVSAAVASQGAVSRHPCLGMAAAEQLQPRRATTRMGDNPLQNRVGPFIGMATSLLKWFVVIGRPYHYALIGVTGEAVDGVSRPCTFEYFHQDAAPSKRSYGARFVPTRALRFGQENAMKAIRAALAYVLRTAPLAQLKSGTLLTPALKNTKCTLFALGRMSKGAPERIVEICNLSRPCSSLLGQYKDPAIADIPIEELIEKADGFAGVFPGKRNINMDDMLKKNHKSGIFPHLNSSMPSAAISMSQLTRGPAARCIGSCVNGYSSSTWPALVATLNNEQDWRHGMRIKLLKDLPEQVPEAELIAKVHALNADPEVHGQHIVQLPLPKHINEEKVLTEISIDKDVDGFHPLNIGKLAMKAETRSSLHSQSTRTVVGTCY